jgi:hypothetical protein
MHRHGAGDDLVQPLAGKVVLVDHALDGAGEHVLVGFVGIQRVGATERDAAAADDCDALE